MNVDDAMETAAAYLAAHEQEQEPLFDSEEVAITLAKEVERLRDELELSKAELAAAKDQLRAGLERMKTASICPVHVRSMWVHESHGSLTVYCRTGESAKLLEKWISDSMKKRNEKWT